MKYEDIQNYKLQGLIHFTEKHGSVTVIADMHDALLDADTDNDFIANFQSKLEDIKSEVEYFWFELELLKLK